MFRVITCLTDEHDLRLVALAGVVCFLASCAAVSLLHRAVAAHGRSRGSDSVGVTARPGGTAT